MNKEAYTTALMVIANGSVPRMERENGAWVRYPYHSTIARHFVNYAQWILEQKEPEKQTTVSVQGADIQE